MNQEQIKAIIEKIPWTLMLTAYLLYLGYDIYVFKTSFASPLLTKQAEILATSEELKTTETRVKGVREFIKKIDYVRSQIQRKAQELDAMKVVLPERIDMYDVDSTITTEAAKSRLQITGRGPGEILNKELYAEQGIKIKFTGVFQQLMTFLDRLSSVQRVFRVEDLEIKPKGSAKARFVSLEGSMELRVYKYFGSKADEIAKKGGPTATSGTTDAGRGSQ